jgi:integrase/recombinase XerD
LKKTGYQRGRRKHVVYADSTLKKIRARLAMLSRSVDLDNPEEVREYIVGHTSWKNTFREAVCDAYQHYIDINCLSWNRPIFQRIARLPNVLSKEQIALVKGEANPRDALIFSLLEEWGLRPIELYETRVRDLDLERGVNNIATAKWGKPRKTERLKPSTLAMLKTHLARANRVFNEKLFPKMKPKRMGEQWNRAKKRVAKKLQDPTILKFRLYDLRHYFATMLYHRTTDILYVKERIGHRNITNTLVYTHLIDFQDDEFVVRVGKTVEEVCGLIEAGFEYVTEMDGAKIFRKRK